jgi:hypothetical protein
MEHSFPAPQKNPENATPRLWRWMQRVHRVHHLMVPPCTSLSNRVHMWDALDHVARQLLQQASHVWLQALKTPTPKCPEMDFGICVTTTLK